MTSTGTSNFSKEGGVTHSISVEDKTLPVLFPKVSNMQKVSFSNFNSFNSLKGLNPAPLNLITEPPESGPLLIGSIEYTVGLS